MNRKEQKLIRKTLLTKLNLTFKRGSVFSLTLRGFGTFHSHRNKKKMGKLRYYRRYSKKKHIENQRELMKSDKYLLF